MLLTKLNATNDVIYILFWRFLIGLFSQSRHEYNFYLVMTKKMKQLKQNTLIVKYYKFASRCAICALAAY